MDGCHPFSDGVPKCAFILPKLSRGTGTCGQQLTKPRDLPAGMLCFLTIAIFRSSGSMYLGICIEVANALDVDHYPIVSRTFECEMTESLGCLSAEFVVNEARVGIVFHVVPLYEVFCRKTPPFTSILKTDATFA